ncbi:hypothetical protein VP01_1193g3 [Puccinia sorghi]|uniref:Uncharacterized protein n=1 Tax=Puccinia sorghi TaxID=27349 RepID=A0A0L6VS69_9BASI|nr:hypothetical protein VP01_1193g3 [Puccinia sorghi]
MLWKHPWCISWSRLERRTWFGWKYYALQKQLSQLPAMFWKSNCEVCTVNVHQILVESLLENGWSNKISFLGLYACQLMDHVCEIFSLNQDWNGGPTTTGKPFVSTRNGMEVTTNYKGKYFIRVFNESNYVRRKKEGRSKGAREAETLRVRMGGLVSLALANPNSGTGQSQDSIGVPHPIKPFHTNSEEPVLIYRLVAFCYLSSNNFVFRVSSSVSPALRVSGISLSSNNFWIRDSSSGSGRSLVVTSSKSHIIKNFITISSFTSITLVSGSIYSHKTSSIEDGRDEEDSEGEGTLRRGSRIGSGKCEKRWWRTNDLICWILNRNNQENILNSDKLNKKSKDKKKLTEISVWIRFILLLYCFIISEIKKIKEEGQE